MAEEAPPEQETNKPRSRFTMTLALILGVTVVEGAGFFAATKLLGGGPETTYGEEGQGHVLSGEEVTGTPPTVEIELLSHFRVPNDRSGRLYVYDFDITAKVPGRRQEEAQKLVAERRGEIADRVAQLVRGAEPAVLREPALKTLRVQIQHAVGEVLGDQELLVGVLIPRCVPSRHD